MKQKQIFTLSFVTLFLWLAGTFPAFSQSKVPAYANSSLQNTFSGIVLDEAGEPVIGANVVEKGTANGVMTNADGEFSIQLPDQAAMLVFSFIGYLTQELTPQANMSVVMKEDQVLLEEVVVVGYGTQKKANLTGAVSQVSGKLLEGRPVPDITRGIQGLIPNLNIVVPNGSPTATPVYNVRGSTSVGFGGSALVLIDDVEADPSMINPNDIESITVLKDAASVAIYGSRAAFGVVLITTKSPEKDRVRINVNSNYSTNQRIIVPDLVTNGYQWAKNFDEAYYAWFDYKSHPTSANTMPFSPGYLDEFKRHDEDPTLPDVVFDDQTGAYMYYGSTDWDKLIHKNNIFSTEQSISASGGSERVNYYVSGRYYHQDGIFKRNSDDYDKYNIRAKGSIKLTDWLELQENFDYTNWSYKYPLTIDQGVAVWRYGEAAGFPIGVVKNPDGSYTREAVYMGFTDDYNNYNNRSNSQIRTTTGLVARLFENTLRLKGDFTYSKSSPTEERVQNYFYFNTAPDVEGHLGTNRLKQWVSNTSYYGSNITAEYQQKFQEKHALSALLGFNVESMSTKNLMMSRDNFILESKPDFNLMDGQNFNITGGGNEWASMGVFYRLNYSYNDRYLVEFNGRYDGSSKFPQDQRFGFFPSVSAGWRITEERFMNNTRSWLDNLKLRASYGSLGNGNVSPYRFIESMNVAKSSMILQGIQPNYTSVPGVLPDGLTWESSTTLDFGLDITALKSRLSLSFDWYDRVTTDMFTAGQPLPAVFGAAVPNGNYADLSTKGWELTLSWNDHFKLGSNPLNYYVSASLWDNTSKITRFNNPRKLLNTYYEGQQIGEIWGYETLGFFQSDEEAAAHADQKFLQNSNENVYLAGDLKFADRNNDGFINQGDNTVDNPGDRMIIGNSAPRYQYGVNVGASYRGVSLLAFFQGIGKRDWYFAGETGYFWGPFNRPYGYQPKRMMGDTWTPENPDAYFPRYRGYTALNANRSLGAPQTRYLQEASYLRLKSLTLEYSLPAQALEKVGLQNVRIFLTGQNLFTFSGLFKHTDNFDPEVIENPAGNYLSSNGQGYAYPMLKSYTAGINFTF